MWTFQSLSLQRMLRLTIWPDCAFRSKDELSTCYASIVRICSDVTIAGLVGRPSCPNCGSKLLAPFFWSSGYVASILHKKRDKQKLDESEQKALTRARRSADLVIAYGKRAVIAQSVYGIGPQTASRVLSKMQESDNEFYKDLLEAKLQFITTRPYWNN